ncbi:hypothetical protein BTO04_00960 [Polaribacter sp. SA4-10]|uniref:hypothetical protein n=1 Tax=Polaribacter sp. SA4-10 TaxID=754397 RepID=UPI000B3CECED|nr:hypothetical protein [Polaribacter sp. SA4-10]ARV05346.1 hypothetical protein BTO04_00960 [Polaribacter sp. SA4-10]
MKKLFLLVAILLTASCGSSDCDFILENDVSGAIDTSLLADLVGNDATALVTLNGESARTFTSEALIGDEISYEIKTSLSNVEIVIINFFYTSGNQEFWKTGIERTIEIESSPATASLKVLRGAVGDEVKFGFTFVLKTDGVIDFNTTYIVDPKIRVRS